MSYNLCPKCRKPIRIPQEEVIVIRKHLRKGKTEDHLAHKICPIADPVGGTGTVGHVGGQLYCRNCGHPQQLHGPKCEHKSYGSHCECEHFQT
ncbi:MAG TPA: hypothetical protein VFE98_11245 [Candidatus Bathyarchaeia archaeon]|nr:hypothetical protein [Candidatus Bathyarchaeia archaeon]